MATAQTAAGPGRNYPDRRYPSMSAMAPHASPREPSHARTASGHTGTDDFRGMKRRAELDEEGGSIRRDDYAGHPNYASSSYGGDKADTASASRLPPDTSYAQRNGAYESPRTHLPPINSLGPGPSDEGSANKRRRPGPPYDAYSEGSARQHAPHIPYSREGIEEERYRGPSARPLHPPHGHNGQPSPPYAEERGYRMPPHSARLPSGGQSSPPHHPSEDFFRPPPGAEDHYDHGTLLARRRGDAAQAKASKLHIDVGSAANLESSAPPGYHHQHRPSVDANLIARSAPPTKVSFSDREGPAPSSNPRGIIRAEPGYPSSTSPLYHSGANGPHTARGGPPPRPYADGAAGSQGQHVTRSPPHNGGRTPGSGGEAPSSYAHSARYGPGASGAPPQLPPSTTTPLTGRFVPQTATLPSPAYHTTRMMQGPAGSSAPLQPPASLAVQPPHPRTAGLTPGPPTARLPDHLRSPPSSKTQFLALFSNFYDSLADSRTLKVTLEDQVRRSNSLLQTLQKSSKVLEATVDRKIREERAIWEARLKALEARVRELEGGGPSEGLSTGSSPARARRESDEGSPGVEHGNGIEARRSSTDSDDSGKNKSGEGIARGGEIAEKGSNGAGGDEDDEVEEQAK